VYPRTFDYVAPDDLGEACALLGKVPRAKVLAGGMSLIPMMKLRVLSPSTVVDIGRIPGLDQISETPVGFEVGALVRHRQIAASLLFADHAAALSEAAACTGDAQVRNRGTLCGSLAHADSSADQTAAVLALGGIMVVRSTRGVRTIAADEFFVDAFTTALADDEILSAVRLPRTTDGEGSAYRKLGRRGGSEGFAVAAAAAWVKVDRGVVVDARVALTGVSTRPVLAAGVSAALVGTDGSPGAVRAAVASGSGVTLIADLFGSEDYKAHLAEVLATQALDAALDRARSGLE